MSNIFDSHCHPQFPQYDADRGEMLERAREAGISLICIGTDLETSKSGVELAREHQNTWATVGAHPTDASPDYNLADFEKLLSDVKVVAIGEIGLDYYRTPETEKQEIQKKMFKEFLDLAVKYNKPAVIHSRDAARGSVGKVHSDLIKILKAVNSKPETKLRGVAHSFTGTIEEANKYLELEFYLGFNGILTFTTQYNELVVHTPLDRILLETDAPYLTPVPYRGKRNEPAYVIEVAKKLAELKNIPIKSVIEQTTANCLKLFKIT